MKLPIRKAEGGKEMLLRGILAGAAGRGKTRTALHLMRQTVGPEGKILVIDTEFNGPDYSASEIWAPEYNHDVLQLTRAKMQEVRDIFEYIEALPYDGIVFDSFTDVWTWYTDEKEEAGDTYGNKTKPKLRRVVEWLEKSPMHVMLTMRAEDRAVFAEGANGKSRPQKIVERVIGLNSDIQYKMGFLAHMNDPYALIDKCRYPIFKIGEEVDLRLGDNGDWVNPDFRDRLFAYLFEGGISKDTFVRELRLRGIYGREAMVKLAEALPGLGQWSVARHREMLNMIDDYLASES